MHDYVIIMPITPDSPRYTSYMGHTGERFPGEGEGLDMESDEGSS